MSQIAGVTARELAAEQLEQRRWERKRRTGVRKPVAFLDWALKVPEPKTGTLNFARFPYQVQIYEVVGDDAFRDVPVRKGTQVGCSALTVRWGLYQADRYNRTILYVFPTKGDVHDFCLARGERVLMADGTTRAIEDVRSGEVVWSSDGQVVLPDVVARVCAPGQKTTLLVELAGGRRLRATREHRVWTRAGWQHVGSLEVGDEVAVPRALPEPQNPQPMLLDDAFLMALWLAEGTKVAAGFTFTNGMPEIRDRVARIAAAREWTFRPDPRHAVRLTANTRRDDGSPAGFLRRYGLRGMTTDTICAPDAIMRAPRPAIEEFVSTYIACDGWVGPRETTVSSASERMIRDLQLLMARLGIHSTVRVFQPHAYAPGRARKAGKRAWTLAIAEYESRERLAKIGVPGKLAVSAGRVLSAEEQALEAYVRAGGDDERVLAALTREVAPAVGWAKVVNVTDGGEVDTFDLETIRHHAYFVEGALTHNSDARVDPMVEGSEYLSLRRGLPYNKGLKRVGPGLCYFRGSENKRALDSVDADGLGLDEYDTLNQANIPDAERRLSGLLSAGLIRRIGVPSHPDMGISQRYSSSDRRKWLARCEVCSFVGVDQETKEDLVTPGGKGWQEISYWKNVYRGDGRLAVEVDYEEGQEWFVGCESCGRPLDLAAGEWVAQRPGAYTPGFHVSRIVVPGLRLDEVVRASKETTPYEQEVFHNKDLGLPYVVRGARLTPDELRAAQSAAESVYGRPLELVNYYDGRMPVTMGVDVASARALNVRISEHLDQTGRKRALWIGELEDDDEGPAYSKLFNMMHRYRVAMAVIDHEPEMRLSLALAAYFPGRIYLVHYSSKLKMLWSVDDDTRRVGFRRTEAIDAMVGLVRRQQNLLPAELPQGYVQHMTANVRKVIVDADTQERRAVWEASRPDDYAQAETYDVIAGLLFWRRVEIGQETEQTYTPLDALMPFARSNVNSYTEMEYRPGPADVDDELVLEPQTEAATDPWQGGDSMYGDGDGGEW